MENQDRDAEIASLVQRVRSAPDDPAVLEQLAAAYYRDGQILPALETYDRIIGMGAATKTTWSAVGDALADVGEFAQAIVAYETSLRLDDSDAAAHHNLGRALYKMGRVEEAVHHLRRATERSTSIDPWLGLAMMIPGCPTATGPTILETRTAFAQRLRRWSGQTAAAAARQPAPRQHRPIRIGYLSTYFDQANYMKPVWALINRHDRDRFEIHLLSDTPPEKGMTGYRPEPADRVHGTRSLENRELAELIRSEGIDILVDLNAYSHSERLPLFLQRPAPLTVAWFNMYATSGLPGFDYVIGDTEVVRPEEQAHFSETIIRLPVSYLTFEVTYPVPPVAPAPCNRNGYVTFGSLVSQYKITPQVLDTWSEIVKGSRQARLILANSELKSAENRQYVLDQFARRGVAPDRIVLYGPADHFTYLRYYDQIDLALDSFPYNGGTTTTEAIWQGVPVLTFDGDRWASRTSQTILRHAHLGSFVANDAEAMIDLAVGWANDPKAAERLQALRTNMRQSLQASPVCDAEAFARQMERAYRWMLGEVPAGGA